jgi:16S rRNA (cytosine967-C5)-methyltransferase
VRAVPATKARGGVSPARACALRVIRRVFEEGAYADRAFAGEAARLEPRDRALAMALSYGTVQRLATLDHVARALLSGPLEKLDPPVLAVLRLGLFELLYLGGAAEHAVVNESVELTKRLRPHAAGLVNAVLRRATREGGAILERLDDERPDSEGPISCGAHTHSAALLYSVPGWLASKWWEELGPDTARALMRVVNEPAESALRVNALVARPSEVAAALSVPTRPAPGLPEGLVLDGPFDVQGSEVWRSGAVQPQSRASMLVSRIVAPQPGQRVLDLCAAPGGKTTHLAALMEDRGEIVAVERHPGRAAALERTVARMRASCVRVVVGDAAAPHTASQAFDRILVDPPCSGLGTLQSRPDLRWRARPEAIGELAILQSRILAAGASALAPGGALVYSVCTISRAEGVDVVEAFLREHDDFSPDDLISERPELGGAEWGPGVQLLPHRDGTDGFFIARLVRR